MLFIGVSGIVYLKHGTRILASALAERCDADVCDGGERRCKRIVIVGRETGEINWVTLSVIVHNRV
jgi:hypothetical protein